MRTPDRPTLSCSSCAKCPTQDCPAKNEGNEPRVHGRSLGLAAIAAFLAPVVLAIVVGLCAGGNGAAQLAGALIGLALGMGASFLCVRAILGLPKANAQARVAQRPGRR
jgi:hypothetical protein